MHQHPCCLKFHQLTRNNLYASLPCTQTAGNPSTVVRPGCTFLRRFIKALHGLRRAKHRYRVTAKVSLNSHNGIRFQISRSQQTRQGSLAVEFFFLLNNEWFNGALSMKQAPLGIAYNELFPIVLDCVLWGSQWQQQRVQFQCDNESVAAVLPTGSSRDATMMQLLIRQLFSGNNSL